MPPRARTVAHTLIHGFDLVAEPLTIVEVVTRLGRLEVWFEADSLIQEHAERISEQVDATLRAHLSDRNARGQFSRFEFNGSSEYLIQGACFISPSDTSEIAEAKRRRVRASDYAGMLREVLPREFEAICRGVLVEMGSRDAYLTPRSNDQGIDFYGRLSLQGRLAKSSALPGFDSNLTIWLVGQAKHFVSQQVATPDIRELVGSVELARARVYADSGIALERLEIRRCDPVFYLFFTTGSISSDGWRLLERSGVIAMDGGTLATFLADCGVAVDNQGAVDVTLFHDWLNEHLS